MFELNPFRGNPESKALEAEIAAQGAKPFEIRTNVVPESVVLSLMKQSDLMDALERNKWPTDEKTCDAIGEKIGLGAEQVAAVSKYCHALKAERESGETTH